MRSRIFLCVCAVFAAAAAAATEYHVNPVNGDDASPGTASQPLRTLNRACWVAQQPGDVIHARPGTYSVATGEPEPGCFLFATLRGAGPDRTVLVDFIFRMFGNGAGIEGIRLQSGTIDTVLNRSNYAGRPPEVRFLRRSRFERADFVIDSLAADNLDLRITVEDCEFIDAPARSRPRAAVSFNLMRSDPYDITQDIRVTLRNNLVVRFPGLFEHDGDWQVRNPGWRTHVTIVNNTVVDSTGDAIRFDEMDGGRLVEAVVSNNLFVRGAGYGVNEVRLDNEVLELRNNLFAGPALGDYYDVQSGLKRSAAEVNALPNAAGNLDGTPLFVDEALDDYRLAAGSPGIDQGYDPSAPPFDREGDERPLDGDGDLTAVADIGADEHRAGAALLRNADVIDLNPLDPERSVLFPLRSPRDDWVISLLPRGGIEDPGILGDATRPFVLYQLVRPGNRLFLVKTTEVRLEYD